MLCSPLRGSALVVVVAAMVCFRAVAADHENNNNDNGPTAFPVSGVTTRTIDGLPVAIMSPACIAPNTTATRNGGPNMKALLGASWCQYNNPFILSDFLSRNSTDLTVRDGEAAYEFSKRCGAYLPGVPHEQCEAIRQIRTASVGMLLDSSSMHRYVIFTDINGHMLFVNFNNNTMAESLRIDIMNVSHFDVTTVRRLGGATGLEPVQDAVVMAANTTLLGLQVVRGDTREMLPTCFLFKNVSSESIVRNRLSLEASFFFPKTRNNFTNLVSLMWVMRQMIGYTDAEGISASALGYSIYASPITQNGIAEYIRTCPDHTPLRTEVGVMLFTELDVTFDVIYNEPLNLTFVVAYTPRSVNVYTLRYSDVNQKYSKQFNMTWYAQAIPVFPDSCATTQAFNYTSNRTETVYRQRTAVYCPENAETRITSVGLFTPDSWKNIGVFNRDVWLAVGLRNASGTYIHMMDMQELTYIDPNESVLLNPLGLPDDFGLPGGNAGCDFATQFNYNGTCKSRFQMSYHVQSNANVEMELSQLVLRSVQEGMNEGLTWPTTNASVPWEPTNWTTPNTTSSNSSELPTGNTTIPVPIVTDQHAVLFASHGSTLSVFTIFSAMLLPGFNQSTEQHASEAPPVLLQHNNDLNFLGAIRYVEVSENAQHAFTAVMRSKWELDSQERFVEICTELASAASSGQPANPFLQAYAAQCDKFGAQPVNLNAFTQYASSCSYGLYCPTLDRLFITAAGAGRYAERPAVEKPCPPGYFCILGQKTVCPFGFYCGEEAMEQPTACPTSPALNVTCASEGLLAPQPCPDGSVCVLTHMPGIGAPPGFMVPYDAVAPEEGSTSTALVAAAPPRTNFVPCTDGDWCSLGRQQPPPANESGSSPGQSVLCPANSFCVNSSVVAPIICRCDASGEIDNGYGGIVHCDDRTLYCPVGTPNVSWCPAGSYCVSPDSITSCLPTEYCAPGSFAPALCPSGKYCPTPAVALPCPKGHYCPRGTVQPLPCNFLTVCPEGSGSQKYSFVAPVGFILTIVGIMVVFAIFRYFDRRDSLAAASEESALTAAALADYENGEPSPRASVANTQMPIDARGVSMDSPDLPLLPSEGTDDTSMYVSGSGAPEIRFEGMGLTLQVGEAKGTKVLDNVTGVIPPGKFVAVMGPSGSGKSTFMHTLAGKAFYGTRAGRVFVNGSEVDLATLGKVTGFVKQDDIMHREMTVYETLLFNARMRYSGDGRGPEAIANRYLKALDLAHVAKVRIGDEKVRGVSGGQRKRVNIGMELVARPKIVFLDEPTSGLDSSSSMVVCRTLRDVAHDSLMTVIAVIHQPRYEIFQMFDRVMLLAKGGKLVYFGPPSRALAYFEEVLGISCPAHANPPDFMLDVISGEYDSGDGAAKRSIDDMASLWECRGEAFCSMDASEMPTSTIRESADATPEAHTPRDANGDGADGDAPTAAEAAARARTTASNSSRREYELTGEQVARLSAAAARPGFARQTWYFFQRAVTQMSRSVMWLMFDLALVLISGLFLGLVFSESKYEPPLPKPVINKSLSAFDGHAPAMLQEFFDRPVDDPIVSEASLSCMAIGMTGVMAALRVFGNEQVVYWRESSAGMSTVAYFVAKNIAHFAIFVVISPLLYAAPFLTFVTARASLLDYYWVLLIVQFATTGLGYLISIVAPPSLSQLGGVVVVLIFAMFGGARPTLVQIQNMFVLLRAMPYISYVRWGQEAFYLVEIREWAKIEGVDVNPSLRLFDYHLDDFTMCMAVTFAFGVGFRLLALMAMLFMHRDQKR